jgi:hypothetical protein
MGPVVPMHSTSCAGMGRSFGRNSRARFHARLFGALFNMQWARYGSALLHLDANDDLRQLVRRRRVGLGRGSQAATFFEPRFLCER